jgi:hypothetical protein
MKIEEMNYIWISDSFTPVVFPKFSNYSLETRKKEPDKQFQEVVSFTYDKTVARSDPTYPKHSPPINQTVYIPSQSVNMKIIQKVSLPPMSH